jgi:hypothetical protein
MPSVLVLPEAGRVDVEGQQAARSRLDGAGSWSYVAKGGRYRIVNEGQTSAAIIVVEANQP